MRFRLSVPKPSRHNTICKSKLFVYSFIFEVAGDGFRDVNTGSSWDRFGRCTKGKMKGKTLARIQSYKQYIRAWLNFHPQSSFYDFN